MADGRQTFQFNASAPVQGQVQGGGGYRSSSVQGGGVIAENRNPEVVGGVAYASGLGDYFDNLMKPAMEREARARFAKGMTDQMYAAAGEEIRAGDGLLTKIFGPTDYEQGAMFYESQNRIADAVGGWTARMDELKRMPKEQVAQEWAKVIEGVQTGDPLLDDVVTQDMLKQTAPSLQAVAKASFAFGQEQVVAQQQTFFAGSAKTFQEQGRQFFETADPNDPAMAQGYQAARASFLQGWMKPPGQTDDSYRKSVLAGFAKLVRDGNGHGATALMQSGLLNALDAEDRAKLEDQYDRFGSKAVGEGVIEFMPQVDQLQGELEFGKLTGEEAVARMRSLNDLIKKRTGFDSDYFDASDQESALKGVWSARRSALEKQEERQFQLQRDEANAERQEEIEVRKEERKVAAARAAFASSNPAVAIAAGAADKDAVQAMVYDAYNKNDFGGMLRSYKTGLINPDVKSAIQNTVAASANNGYSPEFNGLHAKFEGMLKANPAMAKEYFGPLFPNMVRYRQLLTNQTPQVAFTTAFGDNVTYAADSAELAGGRKAVSGWVAKQQPGFFRSMLGAPTLNASAQQSLSNLIGREVAQDSKFAGGDLSQDTLIKGAYQRAINNGSYEAYGAIGWSNGKPTTPLYRSMGMQQQEAAEVIEDMIDKRLKAAGHPEGASGAEYNITRGRYNGKDTLIVVPVGEEGMDSSKAAVITVDELAAAGRTFRAGKAKANAPSKPSRTGSGLLGYGGAGGDFNTQNNQRGYGTRNK